MSTIDPSTVKAGDTVTVHVVEDPQEFDITGKVWAPGMEAPAGLSVGNVSLTAWNVTLTAHQPAPEPELEWKPGTLWADQEGERYWFTDNGGSREDGEGPVFRNDVGDEYETSEMGDVRPLVVIDPTTARKAVVDALATVLPDDVNYEGLSKATDAVVAALGIEAP